MLRIFNSVVVGKFLEPAAEREAESESDSELS